MSRSQQTNVYIYMAKQRSAQFSETVRCQLCLQVSWLVWQTEKCLLLSLVEIPVSACRLLTHTKYIYTYTAGDSLSPKSSFNVPMWGFIANNSRRAEFWISDSPVWRLSQACEHAAWLKYTPLHCGAEEETCLWKVLCMREKRPLIPDKEPMRDSDKVSASPGPYLMLLSDCTAPTISQSLHPLSTSLKHSHQHHHRHTHTRSNILNTVPAYWLLWHAPIVEQMVHLISCKIGTVLCYLMGKGHKMTIFSPFRKTEQKNF